MKRFLMIAAIMSISACSGSMAPGQSESDCDKNPESCSSVRQAHRKSDGPVTPIPTTAALQRGDVMRVWVAPTRDGNGVLRNSGHVYLE